MCKTWTLNTTENIIFHVQDMDFKYYREHNNDRKLNLYARMKYYKKQIIRKA